jgi:hypothetical protein
MFESRPVLDNLFRWYDYSRVDVDLRQAGFEEFKGGRHIHRRLPKHRWMADSRPYKLAFGEYDIESDKVSLWTCGSNM